MSSVPRPSMRTPSPRMRSRISSERRSWSVVLHVAARARAALRGAPRPPRGVSRRRAPRGTRSTKLVDHLLLDLGDRRVALVLRAARRARRARRASAPRAHARGELGRRPARRRSSFGLPTARTQLLLHVDQRQDLAVRELQRRRGSRARAAASRRPRPSRAPAAAGDDQVEVARLAAARCVGFTTSCAVDPAEAHRGDRAEERDLARS